MSSRPGGYGPGDDLPVPSENPDREPIELVNEPCLGGLRVYHPDTTEFDGDQEWIVADGWIPIADAR